MCRGWCARANALIEEHETYVNEYIGKRKNVLIFCERRVRRSAFFNAFIRAMFIFRFEYQISSLRLVRSYLSCEKSSSRLRNARVPKEFDGSDVYPYSRFARAPSVVKIIIFPKNKLWSNRNARCVLVRVIPVWA